MQDREMNWGSSSRTYYAAIFKSRDSDFSAFVPGVDGCIAVAKQAKAIVHAIQEALSTYMEYSLRNGHMVPLPISKEMAYEDAIEAGRGQDFLLVEIANLPHSDSGSQESLPEHMTYLIAKAEVERFRYGDI